MKFIFGTAGAGRKIRKVLSRLEQKIDTIMQTQAELEAELLKLQAQQNKIAKEQSDRFDVQTARIAALEQEIRNSTVTDGVNAAFAALKEATDALDATIPDAPEVPPATE